MPALWSLYHFQRVDTLSTNLPLELHSAVLQTNKRISQTQDRRSRFMHWIHGIRDLEAAASSRMQNLARPNEWEQGRNKGGTMPRRRKVLAMSQVVSSIQYVYPKRPHVRTWGRQTYVLPWTPSNLGTPLNGSSVCKVWEENEVTV